MTDLYTMLLSENVQDRDLACGILQEKSDEFKKYVFTSLQREKYYMSHNIRESDTHWMVRGYVIFKERYKEKGLQWKKMKK